MYYVLLIYYILSCKSCLTVQTFICFFIHAFELRMIHENKYLLYFQKKFPKSRFPNVRRSRTYSRTLHATRR